VQPSELGDIGDRVLFENERIRVWEMTLEPQQASALALGILVAWTVMFFRVVVLVAAVNRGLTPQLGLVMTAFGVPSLVICSLLWRRQRTAEKTTVSAGENPFELGAVGVVANQVEDRVTDGVDDGLVGRARRERLPQPVDPEGQAREHGRQHAEHRLERVHRVEQRVLFFLVVFVVGERLSLLHDGADVDVARDDLAADAEGEIVLVARADPNATQIELTRRTENGAPDDSFTTSRWALPGR